MAKVKGIIVRQKESVGMETGKLLAGWTHSLRLQPRACPMMHLGPSAAFYQNQRLPGDSNAFISEGRTEA